MLIAKNRLRISPWKLRKELGLIYFAFQDSRTPLYAKLPAIAGLFYLLSPVDIIPDFIPFVGYVDDIIIVPLLLNLSIRLLSAEVMATSMEKVNRQRGKMTLIFCVFIVFALAILIAIFMMFKHLLIK